MNSPGDPTQNPQDERLESALSTIRRLFSDAAGSRTAKPQDSAMPSVDDVLANLHVAAGHLHRSLDVNEVLVNLREVLINLVGAARFHLHLLDPSSCQLVPLADESMGIPQADPEPLDDRFLGRVARTGVPSSRNSV